MRDWLRWEPRINSDDFIKEFDDCQIRAVLPTPATKCTIGQLGKSASCKGVSGVYGYEAQLGRLGKEHVKCPPPRIGVGLFEVPGTGNVF
jgi:hypothetical protein